MNKSTAYESYIELGYTGSENSKEFNDWYEKLQAFYDVKLDATLEIIANGLKDSATWNARDC